jgi:hypothetical protein
MSNVDTERNLTGDKAAPRRIWFRIEEVEISWLPVGEAAFLLWVLVLLVVVWLGLAVALGLV